MDNELQDYVDDMRDLFITKGWVRLLEEVNALADQFHTIDNINTKEQLDFAKGVIFAVNNITSLPDQIVDAEAEMADAQTI